MPNSIGPEILSLVNARCILDSRGSFWLILEPSLFANLALRSLRRLPSIGAERRCNTFLVRCAECRTRRSASGSMAAFNIADSHPAGTLLEKGRWRPLEGSRHFKYASWQAGIDRRLTRLLNRLATRAKDVYCFGVYTGMGMRKISAKLPGFGHLWGFDSFVGLPHEQRNESGSDMSRGTFRRGAYSTAGALEEYNLTRLIARVHSTVERQNTTYVPGFFATSLTPALLSRFHFQPALLVDVDVDLYKSAYECLDWMFASGLVVPSTFVRYDDWPVSNATDGPAKGTMDYGEAKAHRLITAKYAVEWKHVARSAYQVVAIGSMRCGHDCEQIESLQTALAKERSNPNARPWREARAPSNALQH